MRHGIMTLQRGELDRSNGAPAQATTHWPLAAHEPDRIGQSRWHTLHRARLLSLRLADREPDLLVRSSASTS